MIDDRAGVVNEGGSSVTPELDALDAQEDARADGPSGPTDTDHLVDQVAKLVDGLVAGSTESYDELSTKRSPFGI